MISFESWRYNVNHLMIWIIVTCQEYVMISIHDVSPSLEKKISFLSTKSLLCFMDKLDPTLEIVTASVLCMYTFIISTRVHRITFFLNRNIVNLVNDYFLLYYTSFYSPFSVERLVMLVKVSLMRKQVFLHSFTIIKS